MTGFMVEPVALMTNLARSRRNLLFDLDGTLVDSNAVVIDILQNMLIERGSVRRIDPVEARPLMSLGGGRLVAGLLDECCGDAEADVAEFRTRYMDTTTSVDTVFDGVLAGLEQLAAAGFTMAICSNKPQALCERVLADTGIGAFMAATAGGRPDRASKPAPDLLHAVLGQLGQDGTTCIFVGDSDLDYRVARDADIPFAFMTYGYAEAGWQPKSAVDWHVRASQNFDHFGRLVDALLTGTGASGRAL